MDALRGNLRLMICQFALQFANFFKKPGVLPL